MGEYHFVSEGFDVGGETVEGVFEIVVGKLGWMEDEDEEQKCVFYDICMHYY